MDPLTIGIFANLASGLLGGILQDVQSKSDAEKVTEEAERVNEESAKISEISDAKAEAAETALLNQYNTSTAELALQDKSITDNIAYYTNDYELSKMVDAVEESLFEDRFDFRQDALTREKDFAVASASLIEKGLISEAEYKQALGDYKLEGLTQKEAEIKVLADITERQLNGNRDFINKKAELARMGYEADEAFVIALNEIDLQELDNQGVSADALFALKKEGYDIREDTLSAMYEFELQKLDIDRRKEELLNRKTEEIQFVKEYQLNQLEWELEKAKSSKRQNIGFSGITATGSPTKMLLELEERAMLRKEALEREKDFQIEMAENDAETFEVYNNIREDEARIRFESSQAEIDLTRKSGEVNYKDVKNKLATTANKIVTKAEEDIRRIGINLEELDINTFRALAENDFDYEKLDANTQSSLSEIGLTRDMLNEELTFSLGNIWDEVDKLQLNTDYKVSGIEAEVGIIEAEEAAREELSGIESTKAELDFQQGLAQFNNQLTALGIDKQKLEDWYLNQENAINIQELEDSLREWKFSEEEARLTKEAEDLELEGGLGFIGGLIGGLSSAALTNLRGTTSAALTNLRGTT